MLPVRFVIDNQAQGQVAVTLGQTLGEQCQTWPLLTADQAYERIKRRVEVGETIKRVVRSAGLLDAAGTLVGAAVGVIMGKNVGTAAAASATVGVALGGVGGGP